MMMGESVHWWITKDGDEFFKDVFDRHYSRIRYRDGRNPKLFIGPGFKIPLRTFDCSAIWCWRKFKDVCIDERTAKPQEGINNSIFRNESKIQSSELIRQADAIADFVWPGERHYTYIDASKVKSRNPGYCYLVAGWRKCGITKSGKLILERVI